MPEQLSRPIEREQERQSEQFKTPSPKQLEQMDRWLRERHSAFFKDLAPKAQEALVQAGAVFGYESVSKVIDVVQKDPQVRAARTPQEKTSASMDALQSAPASPQIKTERQAQTARFAWSFYNESLGKAETVTAQSQSIDTRVEVESDGSRSENRPSREFRREAERRARQADARQAQFIVQAQTTRERNAVVEARRLKAQASEKEPQRLSLLERIRQSRLERERDQTAEQARAESLRADSLAPTDAAAARSRLASVKAAGSGAPSRAAQVRALLDARPRKLMSESLDRAQAQLEALARQALDRALKSENLAPLLDFVIRKGPQPAAGALGQGLAEPLLEVDPQKAAALESLIQKEVTDIRVQILALTQNPRPPASKADERDFKRRQMRLRALKRRLAFLFKAKGAIRRLAGGFFGSVGSLLGGLFGK